MPHDGVAPASVEAQPVTTSRRLTAVLKSARDIMRKDKGLSGDVDRLPMLTWIMFLKFLDDLELQSEEEATLAGTKFRPAIEPPFRWRDWAANPRGITGDELLSFVNQEKCVRPDGTEGLGLFAYLRRLTSSNGDNRRDVIARVFQGVDNRMRSGYLLREVVNKIGEIHFTSTDERHTLSGLYETMLQDMRDAAGDSGEFYTPRPVVRFMVDVVDPRLGETVLDPASGTGGFLVEAFQHLDTQVQTVGERRKLQSASLFGCEAKPLPFLLCQVNLLLHGLESPQIDPENALRFPLSQIGDRDRVDVILTNPPFGGEEERGILKNFPEDRQTAETALLFLQLIMRRLRRAPKPGRAGVVVPLGTLFGEGVATRIKESLIADFNLHTVVKLPNGVFAPYTGQETALLFFDRTGPTTDIWYYEHPLPPDRAQLKNPCYIQSRPLRYEEFAPLLSWWTDRRENDCAWKVSAQEIIAGGYNLDLRHPSRSGAPPVRSRNEVATALDSAARELGKATSGLIETLRGSEAVLAKTTARELVTLEQLGVEVNPENRNPEKEPEREITYVDLASVNFNTFDDLKTLRGADAPSRARRVMREGDVLLSTVRPYLGGHAVVPEHLADQICSTGFAVLRCGEDVNPRFIYYMLIAPQMNAQFYSCMRGAHYPALKDDHVRALRFPKLSYAEQTELADKLDVLTDHVQSRIAGAEAFAQRVVAEASAALSSVVADAFGDMSATDK